MKLAALVAVPCGVTTVIFPVVAPAGTVALTEIAESGVNDVAALPLNETAEALVRFVPDIVTTVPTGPLAGVNPEIVAGCDVVTVKFDVLVAVPCEEVTLIGPVVAPAGTVALSDVDDTGVMLVAAVVLNLTDVTPVRAVPVIVTTVPTGPVAGVKPLMVGAAKADSRLTASMMP